jgi:hypothetical protein
MIRLSFRHCTATNIHSLACPVGQRRKTARLCCRESMQLRVEALTEPRFAGNSAMVLRYDWMFPMAELLLPVLMARSTSRLTTTTALMISS